MQLMTELWVIVPPAHVEQEPYRNGIAIRHASARTRLWRDNQGWDVALAVPP